MSRVQGRELSELGVDVFGFEGYAVLGDPEEEEECFFGVVFRLLEDLPHLSGQVDGRVIVVAIVDADVVFESDD